LVRFAVSDDPAWRHVALVCGAGLGKTTNLKWLEAAVNGLKNGCERPLAFALDLEQLPDNREALLQLLVGNIMDRVEAEEAKVRHRLRRLLAAGRVTFLLDSLDQSDPNPKGPVVAALRKLVEGVWRRCRVWISGRPYAFRTARPALQSLVPNLNWRFLRIGQLDEPECRQLLETAKPPGSR
jgi:predicted NACHT family NTPase